MFFSPPFSFSISRPFAEWESAVDNRYFSTTQIKDCDSFVKTLWPFWNFGKLFRFKPLRFPLSELSDLPHVCALISQMRRSLFFQESSGKISVLLFLLTRNRPEISLHFKSWYWILQTNSVSIIFFIDLRSDLLIERTRGVRLYPLIFENLSFVVHLKDRSLLGNIFFLLGSTNTPYMANNNAETEK